MCGSHESSVGKWSDGMEGGGRQDRKDKGLGGEVWSGSICQSGRYYGSQVVAPEVCKEPKRVRDSQGPGD